MHPPARPDSRPPSNRPVNVILTLGGVVLAALFAVAVIHRVRLRHQVVQATADMAETSVTVLHPRVDRTELTLTLPGSVMPYYDAPIYARTNGYLKKWYFDIGSEVKEGQLLADIETPEIDQQLNQAEAQLQQAKANLALAQTTAQRWKDLLQKNAVARQDVDEKLGSLAAQQAALNAASAEVHRLENMQSFNRIVAPFSGIVTVRNTDVGDLINSGGASGGQELFRVAQTGKLRIYVNVPEVDSALITVGTEARIALASAPGRPATGRVTSTAKSIDPTSRTLLTEIQIPNPGGRLLPGSYAEVTFRLVGGKPPLVVPINTILFLPAGPAVGLVDRDGLVTLRPIEIGRNLGTTVEVSSGLTAEDSVILNPSDSLASGTRVHVVSPRF